MRFRFDAVLHSEPAVQLLAARLTLPKHSNPKMVVSSVAVVVVVAVVAAAVGTVS